ncbi:uncharacterized protein LOC132200878 [Neocloeon triangulifer]|uniref:uncharacterized protein LOC132200878 n=1 Tax=Neocloeon triangulifer TaxID=2078957 RepID=UPI00286F8365|nr:uncharacterized protein LOC132200878 [Neocloeon triangulifer]
MAAVVSFLDKSRGGVSLALFVPSAKQFASAIAAVKFLRMCNTHVQNQVNWHFVLPKGVHIQDEDLRMLRIVSDCSVKVEDFVRTHNLGSSLQKNGSWPESLARNVARRHCQNEWVTVLEAETPPFKDLRLPRFLAQVRCKRCVFLLPLYETSGQREAPKDKQALLEAVNRGEATAAVEGLDLWERGPPTQEIKSIALTKNVPLDKNIFFVATHEIPKFDERYLAKHSTWAKAAQVLEMQLAGFKLFVLDPLFLWRRRRAPSFQRDEEGQQIFAHHLRELSLVYDKYLPKLMATYPYHNPTVVQVCKAKQKTQIVSNLKDNPSFKYGLPPPGKLGFQL